MAVVVLGSIASEILIIAAIFLVLFIILKLGQLLIGLILNAILGLIAIFLVNSIFGPYFPQNRKWNFLNFHSTARM